jgi:hypothetical protein
MKVKCVTKNIPGLLPKEIYDDIKIGKNEDEVGITVNKEYVVYGISTIRKYPWYLICEDHFDGVYINYPMYFFNRYFEITDGRLSSFWAVADNSDYYDNDEKIIKFGFKEWITEPFFYSNLIEGMEREIKIFLDYKTRMDSEF